HRVEPEPYHYDRHHTTHMTNGAAVEPTPGRTVRRRDVAGDPRQRLARDGDDLQKALRGVGVDPEVGAPEGLRGAVDRRQRRPQLVRDRRDEVALQLLERPLLRHVAKRVDDAPLE